MELKCASCGQIFGPPAHEKDRSEWKCPACGARVGAAEPSIREQPPSAAARHKEAKKLFDSQKIAPPPELDPADTVFQPHLMADTIMQDVQALENRPPLEDTQDVPGATQLLKIDPSILPSPPLEKDLEGFFLILGAPSGKERLPIVRAKTVFGRGNADIKISDRTISGRHFQIEVSGREFFIRDLESSNGTFLNGKKIQYSQLLPGDQVTVGKTNLIFRTAYDDIDRK